MRPLLITTTIFVLAGTWCAERFPVAELTHRTGPIPEEAPVDDQQRGPSPGVRLDPLRPLLDAIMRVESGGDCNAIGDGGSSIGPYQIGKAYWIDACGADTNYEKYVRDRGACEAVMFAYWNRYCRKAMSELDFETMARVHNGGPRGATKSATVKYWRRVKAAMGDK